MKLNRLIFLLTVLFVATASAETVKSPPPAAALNRPALQSARATKMAILAVTRVGNRILAAGERGIILYSDNNGRSWRQAKTPTSVTLTSMRFATKQLGWAVGHMGVVLHTNDGGQTWVKQLDGIEAARLSLEAAQKDGDERAIRDAERLVEDGADKPFFDVYLVNDHTLYIIGAYNLILRSDSGGQTWTAWQDHVPNPRGLHLYSMRAIGDALFIAGEQGLMLRSDDGGEHFEPLESPYRGSWFGLLAGRDGELLAYGLRGNVYLTKDDGKTWQQSLTGTGASISAGTELTDGRIVLVSQAGEILISNDQGADFKRLQKTGQPFAAVAQAPDGLVIGGLRGVHTVPLPAR
jgi:photosystem II stability/assembly factor-like uncharacterized protein